MQLREARKRKGLTLDALAKRVGVNKSTICRLEQGKTRPMHGTAVALERALRVRLHFRCGLIMPRRLS